MAHWRQNHESDSKWLRSSDLYDSARVSVPASALIRSLARLIGDES